MNSRSASPRVGRPSSTLAVSENMTASAMKRELRARDAAIQQRLSSMNRNSLRRDSVNNEERQITDTLRPKSLSSSPMSTEASNNSSVFSSPLSRRLAALHGLRPSKSSSASASASPPQSSQSTPVAWQWGTRGPHVYGDRVGSAAADCGGTPSRALLDVVAHERPATPDTVVVVEASPAVTRAFRTKSPTVPQRFLAPTMSSRKIDTSRETNARSLTPPPQQTAGASSVAPRAGASRRTLTPPCAARRSAADFLLSPHSTNFDSVVSPRDAHLLLAPTEVAVCRAAHLNTQPDFDALRSIVLRADIFFPLRETYVDARADKAVVLRVALAKIKQMIATTTPFPTGIERRLRDGAQWTLRLDEGDLRGLRKLQAPALAKCLCDIVAVHDFLRRIGQAEHHRCVLEVYLNASTLLRIAQFSLVREALQK